MSVDSRRYAEPPAYANIGAVTVRHDTYPIAIPLGVSLLVHALLFWGAKPLWNARPFASAPAAPAAAEKDFVVRVLPESLSAPDPRGQIVDLGDLAASAMAPEHSRYLSDRNVSVDRETQARETGRGGAGGSGAPRTAGPRGGGDLKLALPERVLEGIVTPPGEEGNPGGNAPSNYLPGVDFGIDTQLSAREYKFGSYFIRIKRQLEAVWSPRSVIQTRSLSKRNYTTTLDVTLNAQGYLESVEVQESSGSAALDQEAIRAVRAAAPYLNPPTGMIENGKVHIDDFRFIVTLNSYF